MNAISKSATILFIFMPQILTRSNKIHFAFVAVVVHGDHI